MDGLGAEQFFRTFVDQWKSGTNAELKFFCERGYLRVSLNAEIGPWKAPAKEMCPNAWVRGLHKASPSRLRRRERRAAEREQVAAAEEVVCEKTAKKTNAEIAEAGRNVAEIDAAEVLVEMPAAGKAAVERAAAEKDVESAPAKMTSDTADAGAGITPAENDAVECAEVATTSCRDSKLQCLNCDGDMTPEHQCRVPTPVSPEPASVTEEHPPPLPLCHYCCHRGSGNNPVHYYLQCICRDKVCSCKCYCTEQQLEHRKLFFPGGFCDSMKPVDPEDRLKAKAVAEARTVKLKGHRPCENQNCAFPC